VNTRRTLCLAASIFAVSAVSAYANADTPFAPTTDAAAHIHVTPSSGSPKTTFAVSFIAPNNSGASNGQHSNYDISASTNATGSPGPVLISQTSSSCDHGFGSSSFKTTANKRVSLSFHPQGSWCVGVYTGKITETETPICKPGRACPQYILLRDIGTFKFKVHAPSDCATPTVPIPANEPVVTSGPTEVISGLYVQGGALIPNCPQTARGPYAGTLTATSISTTAANRSWHVTTHKDGELFVLKLAPGIYNLQASTTGGERTASQTVKITAGHSVRQDVFVDVP
jgi:hypothetical protein